MKVVDPVYVGEGVILENCTIGPNVSIDAGATVRNSSLRDAIVATRALVEDSIVEHSLIGEEAIVKGQTFNNMVAAKDEVGEAP